MLCCGYNRWAAHLRRLAAMRPSPGVAFTGLQMATALLDGKHRRPTSAALPVGGCSLAKVIRLHTPIQPPGQTEHPTHQGTAI
jgi:hypothetical protein